MKKYYTKGLRIVQFVLWFLLLFVGYQRLVVFFGSASASARSYKMMREKGRVWDVVMEVLAANV